MVLSNSSEEGTLRQRAERLAAEMGIDIAYVSAGLSHSHGEPVTQVYIQYRQKKIDEDSRKVMDYILQKGEFKGK